jgi:hypothetical protein
MNIKPRSAINRIASTLRRKQAAPRSMIDNENVTKPVHAIPPGALGQQYKNSRRLALSFNMLVGLSQTAADLGGAIRNGKAP